MSTKPLVSVIMPARNAEPYIDEAVNSVLAQKGVPFELLIAEDASTDGTRDCLKKYGDDSRMRVWRFQKRKGSARARNFLMSRARGKYLAFCDADDKMLPGFTAVFSKALKSHPGFGGVYGDRLIYKRTGKSVRRCLDRRPSGKWDLIEGAISGGGAMIRRSLIRKTGGFQTDLTYLEDCEFFSRLAEAAPFLFLKGKPLYQYRRSPTTLTTKFMKKRHEYDLKILRRAILRRYGFKVPW